MSIAGDPFVMDWDETPEEVDSNATHFPEGYLRVKCIDQKLEYVKDEGKQALKFQVTFGPLTGRYYTERLSIPKFTKDEFKEMAERRMKIFASRMGAVPKGAKGAGITIDWTKGVNVEFILDMKKTQSKKDQKWYTNVDFNGIWPLDHPEIATLKNDVRAKIGLPPIAGNDPVPTGQGPGKIAPPLVGSGAPNATAPTASPPASKMAMDIFG